MNSASWRCFDRWVLGHPRWILLLLGLMTVWFALQSRHFRLDASAETLLLENDRDLRYAREMARRYGTGDFLVVAYRPGDDLLSDPVLADLNDLDAELTAVDGVVSVVSILDAPLLESPPVTLKELSAGLRTLTSPQTDRHLARRELATSPLYRELLVSPDLRTTALLVNLRSDPVGEDLMQQRQALWDRQQQDGGLTSTEREQLEHLQADLREYRDRERRTDGQRIASVRRVLHRHAGRADLVLGGVSMITHDMVDFIRSDLLVFGTGVLLLLTAMLGLLFRRLRWVLLPLLICLVSVVWMIGLLGWRRWEVTVISANFISLQLILTLSLVIHLIVRYRELLYRAPDEARRLRTLETVRSVFRPSFFCSLTTLAGFSSLVLCNIRPVIAFGWMMMGGIVISQVLVFLVFPAVAMVLPEDRLRGTGLHWRLSPSPWFANLTERHGTALIVMAAALLVFSGLGMSRLRVENAFIDYFKSSTEIYRGMSLIDRELGGTTPLDVVVDLEPVANVAVTATAESPAPGVDANESALFAEYENSGTDAKTWFTPGKLEQVRVLHDLLAAQPEVGKVMSLAVALHLAEGLNQGRPLDAFDLNLLFNETPASLRHLLVDPYVSVENNQVRFWVRIRDSRPDLRRNAFLQRVQRDLVGASGLADDRVHLTGMMVLYNNMLQSLFRSQILTLGLTILLLTGMFLVLFRSWRLALIALLPNLLPVAVMLGVMGWLGLPLDMMTITIAAISVGIAVDDTIHYIHRFRVEFARQRVYLPVMHTCHRSIGHAMTYTSVTIIIGFAILGLSNFIPTIAFGLLTGLVMLIAMVTAQTLLPKLILMAKPFGREVMQ